MKKQSDNTNPKMQKEKPNILIHRWKDTNNPRVVYEEALQVRNFPDRERFKDNDTYKMTMIKSMNSALGSDEKVN